MAKAKAPAPQKAARMKPPQPPTSESSDGDDGEFEASIMSALRCLMDIGPEELRVAVPPVITLNFASSVIFELTLPPLHFPSTEAAIGFAFRSLIDDSPSAGDGLFSMVMLSRSDFCVGGGCRCLALCQVVYGWDVGSPWCVVVCVRC